MQTADGGQVCEDHSTNKLYQLILLFVTLDSPVCGTGNCITTSNHRVTRSIQFCTIPNSKSEYIYTGKLLYILDSITPNLPSMHFAYVSFIVLGTVFSMAWYKIVMQHFLVV